MICSRSSPSAVQRGCLTLHYDPAAAPGGVPDNKGKGNRKPNQVLRRESSPVLPYPQRTSAFLMKGGAPVLGPPLPQPRLSLCPPLPAADGAWAPAANLARRCQLRPGRQQAEEKRIFLAGQGDLPPLAIKLKTLSRASFQRITPGCLSLFCPRSLNLVSFSSLPTPSGSRPPATVTGPICICIFTYA